MFILFNTIDNWEDIKEWIVYIILYFHSKLVDLYFIKLIEIIGWYRKRSKLKPFIIILKKKSVLNINFRV